MPTLTQEEAVINRGYPLNKFFIHAILIPRDYTKKESIIWLKNHKYKYDHHRLTTHFHRFMQTNPVEHAMYYTKRLPNGIELVFQKI